jgi:hypothetical protein
MDAQAAIVERVTSGATHDSLSACGGDECDATIPAHRLDNRGGQNCGRHPMEDQPRYKMMYQQIFKQCK